jgi:hypothetical protein
MAKRPEATSATQQFRQQLAQGNVITRRGFSKSLDNPLHALIPAALHFRFLSIEIEAIEIEKRHSFTENNRPDLFDQILGSQENLQSPQPLHHVSTETLMVIAKGLSGSNPSLAPMLLFPNYVTYFFKAIVYAGSRPKAAELAGYDPADLWRHRQTLDDNTTRQTQSCIKPLPNVLRPAWPIAQVAGTCSELKVNGLM